MIMPRIVATVLTSSRRDIIGDAIRSVVGWVDGVLLVDLGITDDTIEVVRTVLLDEEVRSGRKVQLAVSRHAWDDDTAAARNAGLSAAAALGFDVACILDTDERLFVGSEDLAVTLADPEADDWIARDLEQGYAKTRFIRLPAARRFVGACHERYESGPGSRLLRCFGFTELPRTPEQLAERDRYIVGCLSSMLEREPGDVRSLYYRGLSLHRLHRTDEALADFRRVLELDPGTERAACAAWLAAEALARMPGRYAEALPWCLQSIATRPDMPEPLFFAAAAELHMGHAPRAIAWARLAIAAGRTTGRTVEITRSAQHNPTAHYEGPWHVLALAFDSLGCAAEATSAREQMRAALEMRTSRGWRG